MAIRIIMRAVVISFNAWINLYSFVFFHVTVKYYYALVLLPIWMDLFCWIYSSIRNNEWKYVLIFRSKFWFSDWVSYYNITRLWMSRNIIIKNTMLWFFLWEVLIQIIRLWWWFLIIQWGLERMDHFWSLK